MFIIFCRRGSNQNNLMSNSVDDWVSGSAVICNGIPGLTKEQKELCHMNPDVTAAAIKGLQMAISECQHQFMWHRWNCSSLTTSSRSQQSNVMLQRGKLYIIICVCTKAAEQKKTLTYHYCLKIIYRYPFYSVIYTLQQCSMTKENVSTL